MNLGKSLHDLMEENTLLLSGSIEANRRVLDVITQAVQEQRKDDAKTYSENGKENGTGSIDRKSTRLNSSHITISYADFCLKKKKKQQPT